MLDRAVSPAFAERCERRADALGADFAVPAARPEDSSSLRTQYINNSPVTFRRDHFRRSAGSVGLVAADARPLDFNYSSYPNMNHVFIDAAIGSNASATQRSAWVFDRVMPPHMVTPAFAPG
jgi:hypothetical protein